MNVSKITTLLWFIVQKKFNMLRIFLTPIFAVVFISLLTQCTDDVQSRKIDFPLESFQAGDIVFRRGEGFASRMVIFNDPDGDYSHVGMIVQKDSTLVVVHALPGNHPTQSGKDLVRAESIAEFFSTENALYGKVMRLQLNDTQRSELSKSALRKVEDNVAFDHNYNCLDTTKLYCTELLQLLYMQVGIDISEGRTTRISIPGLHADIIMPADIHRNKQLTTIFSF